MKNLNEIYAGKSTNELISLYLLGVDAPDHDRVLIELEIKRRGYHLEYNEKIDNYVVSPVFYAIYKSTFTEYADPFADLYGGEIGEPETVEKAELIAYGLTLEQAESLADTLNKSNKQQNVEYDVQQWTYYMEQ